MLCATCNAIFHKGTYCGFCKNHYCFMCSQITEADYGNLRPYLKAAWKCPSCRGEAAQPLTSPIMSTPLTQLTSVPQVISPPQVISYPHLSSAALSGNTTVTDLTLQEITRKLNDISSKLECLPKLAADIASLRSELRDVKKIFETSRQKHDSKLNNTKEKGEHNAASQHSEKQHLNKKAQSAPAPVISRDNHDPFAFAPKSSFDLDDFKRYFTREEEHKSIPYFWEKFDPENWSIWYSEYKYPQELTKVFMSCNCITGMFQRLDKMRKEAFASVCLFGEDNNSSISGVWVWRGHDLIFKLSPDWQEDYEYYSWHKLDPLSQQTLRLVQTHWSRAGGTDVAGRALLQGKIFK